LRSYRDLEVWQRAVDLVEAIYAATADWSRDERFGLTAQARRAATSIPANIAEGYGRDHRGDYLRFLSIAAGSVAELETHLIVAARLDHASREDLAPVWSLAQDVAKMLTRLRQSLKQESTPSDTEGARSANPRPPTPDPRTPTTP
jgi:four helix bundle protein